MNLGYGDLLGPHPRRLRRLQRGCALRRGSAISEANIRGRLYGRRFGRGDDPGSQFMVMQAYSFSSNNVYEFGGQSVGPAVTSRHKVSDRSELISRGARRDVAGGVQLSVRVRGES